MLIDKFIVIALSMLIYLPGSNMGSYIRLGVLAIAFVLTCINKGTFIERKNINLCICMVISPIFSSCMVFLFEHSIVTSLVMHEVIRMAYCALLFLTITRLKIPFKTVYIATLIAFIPNFIIQIMQYLQYQPIFDFIRQYYVVDASEWTHLELATYEGVNFRSGSIFLNPNVYMVIPMIALCVFLFQDRKKSSIFNYLMILMSILSCLFTGSRTAIVVIAIVIIVYFIKYANTKSRVVFILGFLFMAFRYGADIFENSRAMQLEDDGGSLSVKINSYFWYLQNTPPFYWITGSIGLSSAFGMDSELGHIFSWYGVFGLYWYIKYYKKLWNNNKSIKFYSKIITIVCILTALTASVMLCMPIYSYVAAITLVVIKTDIKQQEVII